MVKHLKQIQDRAMDLPFKRKIIIKMNFEHGCF